jgi:hypothetical protein
MSVRPDDSLLCDLLIADWSSRWAPFPLTYHAVAFCTAGLVLMFGQPQSRITPRTQGSGENSKRAVPAREVTNYRSRDQNGSFQPQQRTKSNGLDGAKSLAHLP